MPTCRPETIAFAATAPLRVHAARTLPATPERVFEVLADAPGWASWFPGVTGAEWTSSAPYGVGSTRSVHLGPMRVDEEFIAWEPGARFGFTFVATTAPFANAGVELAELVALPDGGTRITYTMAVDPVALPGPVARLGRPALSAALGRGLAGLERHLARG